MSIAGCAPSNPQLGQVVFDPVAFVAAFPQFSTIAQPALSMNFFGATQLLNNSCASVVKDAPTREYLLFLLTAHITKLLNGENGQPPTDVVGRIAHAQQGSVSVRSEFGGARNTNESEAYLIQTQYGAMFLKMTAQYKTMRYYAPPRRCYGAGLYGFGNGDNPFVGDFGNGDGNC